MSRAEALVAAHPQNKEVKFFRADLAFLLDAPDLEKWLAPLMERGASNSLWVAETIRMRYAYALARRGDTMKAAALIDETERILSSTTEIIKGSPNPKYISTSSVERQNLTRRMRIRRFTRLTNGFSKKLENHTAAVALLDAAEKKAA